MTEVNFTKTNRRGFSAKTEEQREALILRFTTVSFYFTISVEESEGRGRDKILVKNFIKCHRFLIQSFFPVLSFYLSREILRNLHIKEDCKVKRQKNNTPLWTQSVPDPKELGVNVGVRLYRVPGWNVVDLGSQDRLISKVLPRPLELS